MALVYRFFIPSLWLLWILYWILAAAGGKPSVRRESIGSRALHIVPLVLAGLLMGLPALPLFDLDAQIVPQTHAAFWAGAVITAAGLLFAVWARRHIGANWSGTVTIKQGHELICSGPYAYVRHPIYSGLVIAFAGGAIALCQWRGLLSLALATTALWRKLRLEERWLGEQFGPAYADYRRRVAALIPFLL